MPYETRSRTGKKPEPKEVQFVKDASKSTTATSKKVRKVKTSTVEEQKHPAVKKDKSSSRQKTSKPTSSSSGSESSTKSSSKSNARTHPIPRYHLAVLTETEEDDDDGVQVVPPTMIHHRAQYGKFHDFLYTLGTDPSFTGLKSSYTDIIRTTEARLKEHMKLKEQEKSDPQGAVGQTPLGKKLMSGKHLASTATVQPRRVAVESTIKELNDSYNSELSFASTATTVTNTSGASNVDIKPKTPTRKLRNRKKRNSFVVVKSPWAKQRVTRGAAKKLAAKKEKEIAEVIAKELRDERTSFPTSSLAGEKNMVSIKDGGETKSSRIKRKVEATVDTVTGISDDFYLGERALNPSVKKRRMEKLQMQNLAGSTRNLHLFETKDGVSTPRDYSSVETASTSSQDVPTKSTKSSKSGRPPVPPNKKDKKATAECFVKISKIQDAEVLPVAVTREKASSQAEDAKETGNAGEIRPQANNHDQGSKPSTVVEAGKKKSSVDSTVSNQALLADSTVQSDFATQECKPSAKKLAPLNPFVLVERISSSAVTAAVARVPVNSVEGDNLRVNEVSSNKISSKSTTSDAPSKKKKIKKAENVDIIIEGTTSGKMSTSSSTKGETTCKNEEFKVPNVPEVSKTRTDQVSSTTKSKDVSSQSVLLTEQQPSKTITDRNSVDILNKAEVKKCASIDSTVVNVTVSVTNQTFAVPKQEPAKKDTTKDENEKGKSDDRGFEEKPKAMDPGFTPGNSTFIVPRKENVIGHDAALKSYGLKHVVEVTPGTPEVVSSLSATFVMPPKLGKFIHGLPKDEDTTCSKPATANNNQNHTYVVGNTTFDVETPPRFKSQLDQLAQVIPDKPEQLVQTSAANLPTATVKLGSSSQVDSSQVKQGSTVAPPKKIVVDGSESRVGGTLNQNKALDSEVKVKVDAVVIPVKKQSSPRGKVAQDGTPLAKVFSTETKSKPIPVVNKTGKPTSSSSSSSAGSTASASTVCSVPRTPTKKPVPIKKPNSPNKVAQETSAPGSSNGKPLAHSGSDSDLRKHDEHQRLLEKQDEGRRKKELIIQQKKEMQRKKNDEWKAKIEKKKAEDNKQQQAIIEKSKVMGKFEGFVNAAVQVFAKPFASNPVRHPMNPPTAPFKNAAIPKHMKNSLGKTGASSLPDIHEASDAKPTSSGHNPLSKNSSPAKKVFGSVGQLPGLPAGVPRPQLGFPTKKSVYHPALAQQVSKSKPITPILPTKAPIASQTATKPKPTAYVQYSFDTTEMEDENESFKTADMTIDLENEVISSYEITRYEDLDEENRHRIDKPVPDWASNDDKLNMSLFYQQPELIRQMRATCFPRKNVGYKLFPNVRH